MPKRPLILALSAVAVLIGGCASPSSPGTSSSAAIPTGQRRQTDRNLDLAIDGEGYFIVETSAGGFLFTRNGELTVSASGDLANGDGYRLYPPSSLPPGGGTISITPDGVVRRVVEDGPTDIIGQIILSRFDNPGRLERDGPYLMPTEASGDPITGKPGTKGLGTLLIGQLEE